MDRRECILFAVAPGLRDRCSRDKISIQRRLLKCGRVWADILIRDRQF